MIELVVDILRRSNAPIQRSARGEQRSTMVFVSLTRVGTNMAELGNVMSRNCPIVQQEEGRPCLTCNAC